METHHYHNIICQYSIMSIIRSGLVNLTLMAFLRGISGDPVKSSSTCIQREGVVGCARRDNNGKGSSSPLTSYGKWSSHSPH